MDSIGKIGVLLPEIVDPLDYDLLHGFHTEDAALTSMQRFAGLGRIFRKILCQHTSCGHQGSLLDGATSCNHHITTNPAVIFNIKRFHFHRTLLSHRYIGSFKHMIVTDDKTVGAHHHITSYNSSIRNVGINSYT